MVEAVSGRTRGSKVGSDANLCKSVECTFGQTRVPGSLRREFLQGVLMWDDTVL
jgi:hypothetical protein